MHMFKDIVRRFIISSVNFITPMLTIIFLMSIYSSRWNWNYMMNYLIGRQLFFFALFLIVVAFFIINRDKIKMYLTRDAVKVILITGFLYIAVHYHIAKFELLIVAYFLFAVIFLRSFHFSKISNILSAVINNESRTPAIFALICILISPLMLIMKKNVEAEQFANYAYYFMVLTVLLRILEMKYGIERENELIGLLQDGVSAVRLKWGRISHIIYDIVKKPFTGPILRRAAIFAAILLLIIIIQSVYWKKIVKSVNKNPEYQATISLVDPGQSNVTFAPTEQEITLPVRITNPLSNPLIWSHEGPNAFTLRALWYEKGATQYPVEALVNERCELRTSLPMNTTQIVQLKITRPLLPGGRFYEVHLTLMHEGFRWIIQNAGSMVKLTVYLESSRGITSVTHELQTMQQARLKLEDVWSDRLAMNPEGYRSKITILSKSESVNLNRLTLNIMNKGNSIWPALGKNAVVVGIAWMQKIKENGEIKYNRIHNVFYDLPVPLLPGKSQEVIVNYDLFEHPDADEIWIGMVHSERRWFYAMGDDVLKVLRKRELTEQTLETIRSQSLLMLHEAKRIESENNKLFGAINDESIPSDKKYRSHVELIKPFVDSKLTIDRQNGLNIYVSITNMGTVTWPTSTDNPVSLGLLWFDNGTHNKINTVKKAENRCIFDFPVKAGATIKIQCKAVNDLPVGVYEVWIGPVHEGKTWFYEKGDEVLKLDVAVE